MQAFSPSDIWAVGANGAALHYDGQSWTGLTGPDADDFKGVWGAAPDDVWMMGIGATYHWDGARLSPIAGGPEGMAIFGSGPADIWTVSFGGAMFHYDGQTWSAVNPPPTSTDLFAGWAWAPNSAWAGGGGGLILHWDGSTWRPVPNTGVSGDVRSMWSSGPNDLWVLTDGGVRRFNGSTWSSIAGAPAFGKAIHGSSPTDVWVTGTDSTSHYDGAAWTTHTNPGSCWGTTVLATGGGGALVGGQRGCLVSWPAQGTAWTTPFDVSFDAIEEIDDMWGSGPSDIWISGGTNDVNGSLTHYDGTGWTRTHLGKQRFNVLWGSGPADVWSVTWQGAFAHFDGNAWAFTSTMAPANFGQPTRMWGRARNDIWLAGQCGTMHYDGNAWTALAQTDCPQLVAIGGSSGGDIWGVGMYGRISRLVNGAWTAVTSPTNNTLSDIVVLAPNDAWAVGDNDTEVHWNGSGWALAQSPTGVYSLTRVWASGPTDVWAAGEIGALRHWNGTAWSISESGAGASFRGLWGTGPGDLWATGDFGTILRHKGGM
jgi:hypothetical protein